MFGFQPIPMGGLLYTLPTPLLPPPPPECNFDLYWYKDGYGYIQDIYVIPSASFPTYIMLPLYNTAGMYVYADYTISGDLPNGLTFNSPIIYGSPGCSDVGTYEPITVTVKIPDGICPGKEDTANLRIKVYCGNAYWTSNQIVINGTAGNTINLDLSNYVVNNPYYLMCNQTYTFTPDPAKDSFTQDNNLVSIKFDTTGYYTESRSTVWNSCQEFSAVETEFIFNIV